MNKTLVVAAIIITGILIARFTLQQTGILETSEQARMREYLEEKYGDTFNVENYRVEGAGLAIKGTPTADAYPKNDPTLRFKVWDWGNYNFLDTYLRTLWSRQGEEDVERFLNETLPDINSYYLNIHPIANTNLWSYAEFSGRTLSLDEVLSQHPNSIRFALSIRSATNASSNEPTMLELERALLVVNYVKNKGAGTSSAYYFYKENSYLEVDNTGRQRYQFGIGFESDNLKNIETIDDLKAYFEKIR